MIKESVFPDNGVAKGIIIGPTIHGLKYAMAVPMADGVHSIMHFYNTIDEALAHRKACEDYHEQFEMDNDFAIYELIEKRV